MFCWGLPSRRKPLATLSGGGWLRGLASVPRARIARAGAGSDNRSARPLGGVPPYPPSLPPAVSCNPAFVIACRPCLPSRLVAAASSLLAAPPRPGRRVRVRLAATPRPPPSRHVLRRSSRPHCAPASLTLLVRARARSLLRPPRLAFCSVAAKPLTPGKKVKRGNWVIG